MLLHKCGSCFFCKTGRVRLSNQILLNQVNAFNQSYKIYGEFENGTFWKKLHCNLACQGYIIAKNPI